MDNNSDSGINTISKIVNWSDITTLPKTELIDIAVSLGVDSRGTIDELSSRVSEVLDTDISKRHILDNYNSSILGGKKAISWFRFSNEVKLTDLKDIIIAACSFNPFKGANNDRIDDFSEPVLVSGAKGTIDGEYVLRYKISDGNQKYFNGKNVQYLPKILTITVLFDSNSNFIEIRTEPKKAIKIARKIANLVKQEISLEQVDIMSCFGKNIENIAKALEGHLVDLTSKPDISLDNFTEDDKEAIVGVLAAIDEYFLQNDIEKLVLTLDTFKVKFSKDYDNIGIRTFILNGLDKIGMGTVTGDLTKKPLYNFLNPSMQHQGAYIKFSLNEDGIRSDHTIRVGLTTKSVQFMSSATEESIRYVRNKLLFNT